MTYVDSAGYVWEKGRVVGRTTPSKAGHEVSEGEYIPASGYEEARKIAPPPPDKPGGTKVKVAIGTTESGEPIEREVYLEEVVGRYEAGGKEEVAERYGEKVAEKVQIEEKESGEVTVSYPVFQPEQKEEYPQAEQPKDYVHKPKEPDYDRAGGFGVGGEKYLSPEQVKEMQREQFKEKLMRENMYAYVDEHGHYVYPDMWVIREQTTAEKLHGATVGRYYEAVGNRYYAEKSIEAAKWLALKPGVGAVGARALGALEAVGGKAAWASRGIASGLTLVGIHEIGRAIREGDYTRASKILAEFTIYGAVGAKEYPKGYRWQEERSIKSISDAVRVTQRRYKVVEGAQVERTPEGGIAGELVGYRGGRFARIETSEGMVLREDKATGVWVYREEPVRIITRMGVKESEPQVVKLAQGQREQAQPYGFGAGAARQHAKLQSEVIAEQVRERTLKPGRGHIRIELPRERGIPGIRFSPFIPVTLGKPERLRRRKGIINTLEAIIHSPRERIQQVAGLGVRTRQAESTIPQLRQRQAQQQVERLGILEEQRTAVKLRNLIINIGGQLKPRRQKRGRPFRFKLPSLGRGKSEGAGAITLNIGKRYTEEFLHPFLGLKIGGRRKRRR